MSPDSLISLLPLTEKLIIMVDCNSTELLLFNRLEQQDGLEGNAVPKNMEQS